MTDSGFQSIPGGRVAPSDQPVKPQDIEYGIQSIHRARLSGDRYDIFQLRHTGGAAQVRRPSLLTLTAGSNQVPTRLKSLIQEVMRAQTMAALGVTDDARDMQKRLAQEIRENENIYGEMIDTTVMIGFVNPRVVPTDKIRNLNSAQIEDWPGADRFYELEVDPENPQYVRCDASGRPYSPKTIYIDELAPEDRAAYFEWCQGNDAGTQGAKAVAPFPVEEAEPLPAVLRSQGV